MANDETLNATQLLTLLTAQRDEYVRLRKLADRQRLLVVGEDAEALLAALADRQRSVEALAAVNERLAPYRREWTRVFAALDDASRRTAKTLLEESSELLSSVMSSDREDAELIGARRSAVSHVLSRSETTGRATAAYAAQDSNPAARDTPLAETHA